MTIAQVTFGFFETGGTDLLGGPFASTVWTLTAIVAPTVLDGKTTLRASFSNDASSGLNCIKKNIRTSGLEKK